MKLYRTKSGCVVEADGKSYRLDGLSWDQLLAHDNLESALTAAISTAKPATLDGILAPIDHQEVWAAGVTYYRSRGARMEESKDAGGGDFYDRVYTAERPELFFKSTASRTAGPGDKIRIRKDAKWSVPEPELTLVINPRGAIVGYTIGNDMSSRDIEGENPLYLPQAKVYDGSCALGPAILVSSEPLPKSTEIVLEDRSPRGRSRSPLRLRRLRQALRAQTRSQTAGRVSLPRQLVPQRMLPHDRNRHRPAFGFHPSRRRPHPHLH